MNLTLISLLNFRGKGFYYMDQVHKINNVRKLPKTDTFLLTQDLGRLQN